MKISVVIATMNRPIDLKTALDSILRQTEPPHEVLIIDQSEDDQSYEVFSELMHQSLENPVLLRYDRQDEKSLVKARNRGIALAEGDIVSFVDDDVVLFEDYYADIRRAFESDPRIAGVGGNVIVRAEGRGFKWKLRKMLMEFFLLSRFNGKMTASGFGYPVFERVIDRPMDVQLLPGCDMNFRKSLIGPERFDEWFKGYSFREDVDFSYRVSQRGRCVMVPEARLYHNYSPSGRSAPEEVTKMMVRNYHHIFMKNKDRHFYSKILFVYSLAGLILIDSLEFLFNGDPERFRRVRAEVSASFGLIAGGAG